MNNSKERLNVLDASKLIILLVVALSTIILFIGEWMGYPKGFSWVIINICGGVIAYVMLMTCMSYIIFHMIVSMKYTNGVTKGGSSIIDRYIRDYAGRYEDKIKDLDSNEINTNMLVGSIILEIKQYLSGCSICIILYIGMIVSEYINEFIRLKIG